MTIALSGTQTCPDTSFSGQHLMTNFKNRPLKKINNITQCPNTLHKSTSTDKNWPLIFPTIYRYVYFSQCVQITQVLFSRRVYLPAETKMLICSDLLDLLDKYSKWCFINTIKHAFFTSVFHTILKNPPASFDWFYFDDISNYFNCPLNSFWSRIQRNVNESSLREFDISNQGVILEDYYWSMTT